MALDYGDGYDPGTPNAAEDIELFGAHGEGAPIGITHGTIGWQDEADVFDMGDASNDGNTFIRVTLFEGHEPGKPKAEDGGANGHQYLVRIMLPFWYIPKKGLECFVAFPDGKVQTPGAGILVGCTGKSPLKQFAETTAKIDLPGYDLVINARSITLRDGNSNSISVSPEGGMRMDGADGSSVVLHDGTFTVRSVTTGGKLAGQISVSRDEVSVFNATGNCGSKWKSSGDAATTAKGINLCYSSSLGLGQTPNPACKVVLSPGPGMIGIGSLAIFASG